MQVLDSWDAAEDSEEEREKAKKAQEKAAQAAKDHKTKTERIAEHQKQSAALKAQQAAAAAAIANETPAERRRREEESDLKHAEALFADIDDRADSGVSSPAAKASKGPDDVRRKAIALADPKDPSKSIDLSALPLFNPTTKQQFSDLQNIITPLITANIRKGQYPLFVQELVRNLVKDMSSENIKKVASIVTTLSNEKLREEKAASSTKKGGKAKKQPALVGAASKDADRIDTSSYADAYDE